MRDGRGTCVWFEERPLYYELAPDYVAALRDRRESGARTEEFQLHYGGATLQNGVLKGRTSPYAADPGSMSTLELYTVQDSPNLFLRYTVDDPVYSARFPNLVCEYERMAGTVKEMAPGVMQDVQVAWEAAKQSVEGLNDSQIDALCKTVTTSPYWSGPNWWNKGFCDAADGTANRAQMVQAFDSALKSLAKEQLTLTNRQFYRSMALPDAPTETYAKTLDEAARTERCADAGLILDDCKLHGAIEAAFLVKAHDPMP